MVLWEYSRREDIFREYSLLNVVIFFSRLISFYEGKAFSDSKKYPDFLGFPGSSFSASLPAKLNFTSPDDVIRSWEQITTTNGW